MLAMGEQGCAFHCRASEQAPRKNAGLYNNRSVQLSCLYKPGPTSDPEPMAIQIVAPSPHLVGQEGAPPTLRSNAAASPSPSASRSAGSKRCPRRVRRQTGRAAGTLPPSLGVQAHKHFRICQLRRGGRNQDGEAPGAGAAAGRPGADLEGYMVVSAGQANRRCIDAAPPPACSFRSCHLLINPAPAGPHRRVQRAVGARSRRRRAVLCGGPTHVWHEGHAQGDRAAGCLLQGPRHSGPVA